MEIAGKVTVVTGAGSDGCGRAIARRFARDGAAVVVSDLDETGGRRTVHLIQEQGGRAAFHLADVRVEEQVRALLAFAEHTFGPLDILINNASAPFRPDQPLEHWDDPVQTDLFGTLYGTRLAIDAMRRHGGGAIVNISSISALWHGRTGGWPPYETAKAGSLRLTTMLAFLARQENIRVNCLAPGWIASAQVRAFWEPLTPEQRLAYGAPARLLQLDEVAAAVVRLATDETLAGRVLVWWSEDSPGLIPWADRGYSALDPIEL
ncbi:MAG: SDR family oxidoreductase [Acidobacteriia bacterium]|nr:SDR family oxidoreductase [Terriglobia bacterium]